MRLNVRQTAKGALMFMLVLAYFFLGTASIALGADTVSAPGCLDVSNVAMTWPWLGTALATLAGSMGTIHIVTRFLLAIPFVQAYPALVTVLQVLSVLGFNKAAAPVIAAPAVAAAAPTEHKKAS